MYGKCYTCFDIISNSIIAYVKKKTNTVTTDDGNTPASWYQLQKEVKKPSCKKV